MERWDAAYSDGLAIPTYVGADIRQRRLSLRLMCPSGRGDVHLARIGGAVGNNNDVIDEDRKKF